MCKNDILFILIFFSFSICFSFFCDALFVYKYRVSQTGLVSCVTNRHIREWPFNTGGGGGGWTFGGIECFLPKEGVNIFFRSWRWVKKCHASLASIFNKCYKKVVFMKNNWIWVYKIWAQGGLTFFTCWRGLCVGFLN